MKAYSLDLRERVAAACSQPGSRVVAVAAQFSVSVSFVEKLLHRQRTTGSVAALPPRSGPAPDLDAWARQELQACLRQEPAVTLAEVCTWLATLGGSPASQSTLWRAVQALGWRRKKERSCRRTRLPARCSTAAGLCRGAANGGFYLLQVRGRDQYQPDLLPPLRPRRRRAAGQT